MVQIIPSTGMTGSNAIRKLSISLRSTRSAIVTAMPRPSM